RAMRVVANRLQGMTARTNAEWAEGMRELLEAAAWGSGAGETSVEFQTRRKWESALDELATLDFDGVQVEFVQALEARETIGWRRVRGQSCSAMRRSRRRGDRGLRRCWRAWRWKKLRQRSCSRRRILA